MCLLLLFTVVSQRLKAALHYTVGSVCNEVEGEMTFSREMVAVLTEAAFKQANLLATDLELFAKYVVGATVSAPHGDGFQTRQAHHRVTGGCSIVLQT